jgi:hypothetical protein
MSRHERPSAGAREPQSVEEANRILDEMEQLAKGRSIDGEPVPAEVQVEATKALLLTQATFRESVPGIVAFLIRLAYGVGDGDPVEPEDRAEVRKSLIERGIVTDDELERFDAETLVSRKMEELAAQGFTGPSNPVA